MAVVFPDIMTAFLAQDAITDYFKSIVRRRVDVPSFDKVFPLLSLFVINNTVQEGAGDSRPMYVANYVFVAAAKLEATTHQDKQVGNIVDAIQTAADQFTYSNISGYSAEVTVGHWDSDEQSNTSGPGKVWVEIPVEIQYRKS